MPAIDPTHWLYRLSPADWLAAAATELEAGEAAFTRHAFRAGVTHSRRAAGMALNAVLWRQERPAWGRSYMEHVTALGAPDDPLVSDEVRAAARRLRETPAQAPTLLRLGPPGALDPAAREVLAAARTIMDWAAAEPLN